MEYFKRFTPQVLRGKSTNNERDLNDNGTTSNIMDRHTNNARTSAAADSWDFSDLDMDNRVDEDGDIVVTGTKRNGEYQDLMNREDSKQAHGWQPTSKRIKLEHDQDTGQSQDSAIGIPPTCQSTADVKPTADARPSDFHASAFAAFTKSTSKSEDCPRGSRKLPFIVADDSDEERPLSPPPPSRLQPQASSSSPRTKLSAAEEEASRAASRRLRLEAQGRRQFAITSKARDATTVHSGNDSVARSAYNEAEDPQNATPQQPEALTRINAFESSRSGRSNLPNSTSVRLDIERFDHDQPVTSKESNAGKMWTPRTARDPADVKRDLAKRLENPHSNDPDTNSGPNKQVNNAWAEAESARRRAVREADAKRDATWREERARQRKEELRKFEDRKQAVASHRQTFTQEYASHQRNMDFRQSALERLQAVNAARRPTLPVKPEPTIAGCQLLNTAIPSAGVALPAANVQADNAFEKSREARIREKDARNAKIREADLEQDREDQVAVERAALRPVIEPSNTPRSLHSIEGQQLLARSDKLPGSTYRKPYHVHIEYKGHTRKLLPILAEDIKLIVWKDHDDLFFNQMMGPFEQFCGLKRSDNTLRKRYAQVRNAIGELNLDQDTYHSLLSGDLGTLEKVNILLASVSQDACGAELPKNTGTVSFAGINQAAHDQVIMPPGGVSRRESILDGRRRAETEQLTEADDPERPRTISITTRDVRQPRSAAVPAEALANPGREQYATKTWSPEAWVFYMQCLQDEWDAKHQPLEEHFTYEDRWEYAYQVQRRQISMAQMQQDDMTVEDMLWTTLGDTYDNLAAANVAAIAAVIRTPVGYERTAAENYSLERSTSSKDGTAKLEIKGENGIVQTRVVRFLHLNDEGKLPAQHSLVPRALYAVMEQTIKTMPGDGLFETGQREITIKPLSNETFSSREMANERAVKRYIALGHRPTSVNLDERDREARELEQEYLGEIDDEEGELFRKTLKSDDDRKEITIWVEEQSLVGPRNIG